MGDSPVRIPTHFYDMLNVWNLKLNIKSKQLQISLAINDYNEKLNKLKLGSPGLIKLNSENLNLCNKWKNDGWILGVKGLKNGNN